MIAIPSIAELMQICQWEKSIHPLAQWVDYYKLCIQSCFGAGHSLTERNDVRIWIEREFSVMKSAYLPMVQPLRIDGEIIRISLSSLARAEQINHRISHDFDIRILSDAFFESVHCVNYDHESWTVIWEQIEKELIYLVSPLPKELPEIRTLLENKTIPSHSEKYKKVYDPHYRVINTSHTRPYMDATMMTAYVHKGELNGN